MYVYYVCTKNGELGSCQCDLLLCTYRHTRRYTPIGVLEPFADPILGTGFSGCFFCNEKKHLLRAWTVELPYSTSEAWSDLLLG